MLQLLFLGPLLLASPNPGAVEAPDRAADVAALVEGVDRLGLSGVPGPLAVVGEDAFPVVVGASDGRLEPVVAAARVERGRVVAFGHGGYLDVGVEGAERLVRNAVRWAGGRPAPRVLVEGDERLARALAAAGIEVVADDAPEIDVIVGDATRLRDDLEIAVVRRFVEEGGGYVTASLGWGWKQLHPGRDLVADHPGNRLLAPLGIAWADGTLAATAAGAFAVDGAPPALAHAGAAWRRLSDGGALDDADAAQAAHVVTRAIRSLPADDAHLLPVIEAALRSSGDAAFPVAGRPLAAARARDRVVLAFDLRRRESLGDEGGSAHPAAVDFPGAPPADAARVRETVRVDPGVPGWRSTGLYAAPGDELTVEVPETAARLGLALRVGAHADRLWHKPRWDRCPEITRVVPLDRPESRVRTPFGGLVYVVVPDGASGEAVSVVVAGAVRAPLYVHGETEVEAWRETIRHRPAPWAEVGSDRIVVTVPSEVVRELDDPDRLMETWNRVLDLCAELAGRPAARVRPERIVCDRQISAGYMHAGYPIMVHLDQIRNVVDADHLAGPGNWGLFHELGHNHQRRDWTFAGTGEVTCNLFTLYVLDRLCGKDLDHETRMSEAERAKLVASFDFAAPDHERWKRSPFLALVMYVQLQRAFGWEAYREVFAEYEALAAAERPRTDREKRDRWMVRFSRSVGRNLGPYFARWGVPVSDAARRSVEDLPVWTCDELP